MAFSPIKGSDIIARQYKRYLNTMFFLDDPDYQRQFSAQIRDQSTFVAGPYLDAHDNFATGSTTQGLVEEGILPKGFLKYGFKHDRPLYTHQEQALRKALNGENIVVSTGTGSGKTESFLMPILASLAVEAERGTLSDGVRALLVYPMNALANDQVERMRELLKNTPEITFGCYTGQTKEKYSSAIADYKNLNGGQSPAPNELISREQMKRTPPHILITNYAMLEYLLVRPGDNVFFTTDTWRYVVLDEAHVYRGSTGIEVAMLLRRLKATLNCTALQYFLTSATLGSEDENESVAEFATDLCDEPFSKDNVIRAVRVPVPKPLNQITVADSVYRYVVDCIDAGESETDIGRALLDMQPQLYLDPQKPLFDMIHRDKKYWLLRQILKEPKKIAQISQQLDMTEEEVEHLVAAASFSEADGIRLLDARYHTFIRATESVFITLPPSKKLFLTRAKEYLDPSDGQSYKVFEISTCSNCHAIYITGRVDSKTGCVEQSSKLSDKDIFLLGNAVSDTDEDGQEVESDNIPGTLCAVCGYFQRTDVRDKKPCVHGSQYEVPVIRIKAKNPKLTQENQSERHILRKCLRCESVNNYGILRRFFTGQEAVTSVIATSLFNALPAVTRNIEHHEAEEDDFGFGDVACEDEIIEKEMAKQFLCFSDSRQASAYFATYLDTSYRRLLYRRIVAQRVGMMREPIVMSLFCEDVRALMEKYDILKETEYTAKDEKLYPVKESWKAALAEAADMYSDASLMGMGMVALGLRPNTFSANKAIGMNADEVNTLFSVLTSSLISDLAIQLPNSMIMTQADYESFSFVKSAPSYAMEQRDAEKNIKSFIPTSKGFSNRRKDYLKRVLDKRMPGAFDDDRIRKLMGAIWKQLMSKDGGIITGQSNSYRMNSNNLYFFKPAHWYRCDKCRKLTPYNIDGVCPTYKCTGHLVEIDPDVELKDNHYYRLCHDMDIRPLRVKEHTAQLDRETAYRYQQAFKDKKIDVLSCSTTFEMGVDVGSLETVFMRNMPPLASNYAQRAGRAGRNKNSAAFALTFCNRSSHDFNFFGHPVDMIRGIIRAPRFNVINEKIAIRHLYASALAFFWRKYPEYFSTVGNMAKRLDTDTPEQENGFELFKRYLQTKPDALRRYAWHFLPRELYNTFGCDSFEWVDKFTDLKEGVLTLAVDEYDHEVKSLEEARQTAYEKNRSTGYIEQRLRTYRSESILAFLSRKNVMPRYGFPVDTVSLAINGKQDNQDYGIELQRDLEMAISEYAPGSQVIANGQLFTGRYLKKVSSTGWKMYDYIKCDECGTLNINVHLGNGGESDLSRCHVCNNSLADSHRSTFIVPSFGFEADPDMVKKPGLIRPEKTYRTEVTYVGYRNNADMLDVKVHNTGAKIIFAPKDEMAVLNRSEFYICKTCGYGEVADKDFHSFKKEAHKNPSGHKCVNNYMGRYSLGYRFETDVFMLYFPDIEISHSNSDDTNEPDEAYSVLYALQRGIVDVLDLEENDIACCLQYIGAQEGKYGFVFYDTTPGGAGHMKQLNDIGMLEASVDRALELMKQCTCGGPQGHASCYACLRAYKNQRLHDRLDRSLAIRYLEKICRTPV